MSKPSVKQQVATAVRQTCGWQEGRYNSTSLQLARGISASVCWAITGPRGYLVTVLNHQYPAAYQSIEDAKAFAEERLARSLEHAANNLGEVQAQRERASKLEGNK